MSESARNPDSEPEISGGHGSILIVEDEHLFARAVSKRLGREGYDVRVAGALADARAAVTEQVPDVVLLDLRLPDGSGLAFLEELAAGHGGRVTVIVMTAFGELDDAVTAMKLGAADYLKKPVDLDELTLNVAKVFHQHTLSRQLDYSKAREDLGRPPVEVIGDSAPMRKVKDQIARMARLGDVVSGEPPTILVTGETGTGKDLVARAIHAGSARAERPFVHVDCASLPKDLIEAELFGHVKGAFTNAVGERTGLIEAAEDGVLFLDEIGELPVELQAKLLAVLERRRLRRVGSSQERPVHAWFIAATNRDLETMIEAGEFRSDLYFRLNVLTLALPALRERGDDLIALATHFATVNARRYGLGAPEMTDDAKAAIARYGWPGNVRELTHVVERAVLLGAGRIDADVLGLEPSAQNGGGASGEGGEMLDALTLDEVEKMMIERALARTGDNVSEAARQLGITRMTMRYRMKKHGLGPA